MTTAEQKQQVALEIAKRDIQDIRALRESEPFRRYFIRRLNQRHDEMATKFKYDKMSHEDREIARRLILEYEDIAQMMDRDELACRALVDIPRRDDKRLMGTPGNG